MHDKPRAQSAKVGRNASNKRSTPLRYLDLSFEGSRPVSATGQPVLNNGFRPHGGHRGTKKYPLSPYTAFSKSADQLDHDVDKLHEPDLEQYSRSSSPAWTLNVCKDANHSGESPLFVHKLLSPSRISQQYDPGNYPQSFFTSHKRVKHKTRNGQQYYRPNRTHQYLSATELRDSAKKEVDVKLGRPTRTTLLRARQRCNSAPVNAYDARRDMIQKQEQRCDSRRSLTSNYFIKDMVGMSIPEGESMHSYLTGARYNRAHCLDSKILVDHGVYMPRDNPHACFIIRKSGQAQNTFDDQEYDMPKAPPESLASASSEEDLESAPFACSPEPTSEPPSANNTPPLSPVSHGPPKSPLLPPQPPSSPSRGAWEDQTQVQVDISPGELREDHEEDVNKAGREDTTERGHIGVSQPVLERILVLDDGLNIKGMGMGHPRPKSARPAQSNRGLTYPVRPQSAQMLPSVVIQGTAINKPTRGAALPNTTTTTVAHHPAPPASPKESTAAPPPTFRESSPEPPQVKVKPVVKTMDKAVNVPSIAGESEGQTTAGEGFREQGVDRDGPVDVAKEESVAGSDEAEAGKLVENEAERPSTAKGKKVRFAEVKELQGDEEKQDEDDEKDATETGDDDNCNKEQDKPAVTQATDDSVKFFLTEDKDEKEGTGPELVEDGEKNDQAATYQTGQELDGADDGSPAGEGFHHGEELKETVVLDEQAETAVPEEHGQGERVDSMPKEETTDNAAHPQNANDLEKAAAEEERDHHNDHGNGVSEIDSSPDIDAEKEDTLQDEADCEPDEMLSKIESLKEV